MLTPTRRDPMGEAVALIRAEIGVERLSQIRNGEWAKPQRHARDSKAFAATYRNFALPNAWFHDAWYDAFDDPALDRIYLPAPREHAKTSVVLTYVLRRLAEDHHLRVGILSGTDVLARRFLNDVAHELASNEALSRDYGGPFQGDKWTEHELVLADARTGPRAISGKDVSLFSLGRGGQISSRHCDLLIVDDVESADSVRSELVRQSTREWWAREVAPVLSPGGKLIVLGTRKHYDDLYSHLMRDEESALWHVLDVASSVYREDGAPIWPEMWSAERLLKRKAELDRTDVLAWAQEYLNAPRPSDVQMFYPEKWPAYTSSPWGLTLIQFWDLAISEKTASDYTVGVTLGVNESNDAFILELRRGHWDFNRTLSEVADMGKKWSDPHNGSGTLSVIGIEQVAYQAAAVQEAIRRTMLPIIPVVPDKDKVTRARLLEARAAAGKVHRPANTLANPWWQDAVTELLYFPSGAHDDIVDAMSGAVRLAGWQADSIAWQYGTYTCPVDGHMFVWEANRPCPKCGTKAPAAFVNPELLSLGEMGAIASSSGNGSHP